MRPQILASLLLFVLLIAACAPVVPQPLSASGEQSAASVTQTAQSAIATLVAEQLAALPTATATTAPTATETPEPTATATIPATVSPPERTSYELNVTFTYDSRSAHVSERIRYSNASGDVLPDLRLMVELAAFRDLFHMGGIWWVDGEVETPVENATWQGQQIHIPLRQPLQPGQTAVLRVDYEFTLPSQSAVTGDRPMPIGFTTRQANLVDWYPFVPPYRSGSGWLAHPPAFYGEHLVFDLADFTVNLTITDQRDDLLVAASAPAEQEGDGLRFHLSAARNFVLSIGHEYAVSTEQVGDVTVSSYYFPVNERAGKRVLQTTVESIELYEELFGPYPHETLAVVEADFLDGMEYDGLYFLSKAFYNLHQGGVQEYLVAIAAHETAHQWWYGVVGNDQANEPWLDEALCTYTEHLYYERYYPEALNWWWQYRVNLDSPRGWVDTTVYSHEGAQQTYRDYRGAVYLNGAHFLHDLREGMGEEAFLDFLGDYAERNAGQIATGDGFFTLLAEHTSMDIAPLLEKYFFYR